MSFVLLQYLSNFYVEQARYTIVLKTNAYFKQLSHLAFIYRVRNNTRGFDALPIEKLFIHNYPMTYDAKSYFEITYFFEPRGTNDDSGTTTTTTVAPAETTTVPPDEIVLPSLR